MIISPSILSADFSNLERDIKLVEKYGADWIHIDVMDGHFVPNITIGAPVVSDIRKVTKMPLDVHLMIENPEKYLDDFIKAGSDIITFHYEAAKNPVDLLKEIKRKGAKAGISIKPKTNPEKIKNMLEFADLVLVMTVEPGFSGQKFMEDCASKIKYFRDWAEKNKKDLIIQVDGGINDKTAKICKEYGATSLVAGNYIYKNKDIKSAIKFLKF